MADDEPSFNSKFCLTFRCDCLPIALYPWWASWLVWISHGSFMTHWDTPKISQWKIFCLSKVGSVQDSPVSVPFPPTQCFEFCTGRVCCANWLCSSHLMTVRWKPAYYRQSDEGVEWARWMSLEPCGIVGLLNQLYVCFIVSFQVNHSLQIQRYWSGFILLWPNTFPTYIFILFALVRPELLPASHLNAPVPCRPMPPFPWLMHSPSYSPGPP